MEDYGWVGGALYITYILFFVALGAAIILPVIKSLGDPKTLIRSGIGVGILLVVFFVCYIIADGSVLPNKAYETFDITETKSKLIGGSLFMTYALLVVTFVGVIYVEIAKFFK